MWRGRATEASVDSCITYKSMTFACSLWESASSMAEDICIIRQAANLAALGCQEKPRKSESERERDPQPRPATCPTKHILIPFPLASFVYWSSVGLCVKTAQQKNPRVATVEAGSLKSSPDERLQLTVGQWAGGYSGDSGTDRQSDIRDIGLTYQVSAHLRHQGL